MIGTYASAALICLASLLVGRAIFSLAGRSSWCWLEPAVGFAAILTVSGILARAPGHGTSATFGILVLLALAAAVAWRRRKYAAPGALAIGLVTALVVALVLSFPFAVAGRWGLLGVGFNNDLGLHLAWAEWLRSGVGPEPDPGYPLGPHGLAVATAAFPGIGLAQAFIGEIFAIGILTSLTALGALRGITAWRRVLGATLVAATYMAASYFSQAAFKETAEALFVLTVAIYLTRPEAPPRGRWPRVGWALPWVALAGGVFFCYSFAGIAWPAAIVVFWAAAQPATWRALRPARVLRIALRPWVLLGILVLVGLGIALTVAGPFGFGSSFNQVAGSNTYGPVSPIETLGIWPAANYRLDAAGGAPLPGLMGAVAVLALLCAVAWWMQRREATIPLALGAGAVVYLASLPVTGDYSQAKALMIVAPLAMLVIIRPLVTEFGRRAENSRQGGVLGPSTPERDGGGSGGGIGGRLAWSALAVVFVAGAVWSTFLALRDGPVAPPGHGAQLEAFLPIVHGLPVLYAGQDRYAAYELLGADTHVPLVDFPDPKVSPNPEKPFDTGDAYSPIDFDSFNRGTLNRFPYVVTGRGAWNSEAPPNFKRIAKTPDFVLWERTGPTPRGRHVLLEGTEAGARAHCNSPETRILLRSGGEATLFGETQIGTKPDWSDGSTLGTGESTSQSLDLPAGTWDLSLQYFSPFGLTISAPGFEEDLIPALDGQRPNTISLQNNGQFWPAGKVQSKGGKVEFSVKAASADWLQSLTGYDAKAYIGELVATIAEPRKTVPLSNACGKWIDWYESAQAP
jgi:MYXO-CTERM domain-containing protein